MNKIDIWEINFNIETIINVIDSNIFLPTKLLNLNKTKYSLFEKFIYDTACFHFKRLNIEINENYYVEFWCKNKFETQSLHLDCDENEKKHKNNYIYPLLSCVTYFNDNESPTVITNVNLENYKYKEFEKQTEIFFSFPRSNKQITFNGNYYHGSCNLNEIQQEKKRYIIAINLWDKKPTNVEYYDPDKTRVNDKGLFDNQEQLINIVHTNDKIKTINACKKIINYTFFEEILYNTKINSYYKFNDLVQTENKIDDNISSFNIILDTTIEKKEMELKLKNKYGNIMDDINEINNEKNNIKYNRFLQRFIYNKIYTPDMCKYIINVSENFANNNGGWTTERHVNYPTTDLPVNKIPGIFGLILETMNTVCDKIKKSYGLHDSMGIDIQDLFIVKYSMDAQNHLEMHHDGSFLSFNILLSNPNDFEGGGTYFDDGLIFYPEQGDLLIHSSKINHAGLPITKGLRYLLVGFLNINIELDNQPNS